jgi:hypothetical protein
MRTSEKSRERWMILAELATKEQDPNKLIALGTMSPRCHSRN